jgi:hypothetical protein
MTTNTDTPVTCPPAEDFPLTCEFCKAEPGTFLAVYDLSLRSGTHRVQKVIGQSCAGQNFAGARQIAAGPAWLFRLVPETDDLTAVRRYDTEEGA